jgi:hypothetical protein
VAQTSIGVLFDLNIELAENDRRLRENCNHAALQDKAIGFAPLETAAASVLFEHPSYGFIANPLYTRLLELLQVYLEQVNQFNALVTAWWGAEGESLSDLARQIRQVCCRTSPPSDLLAARDALINELSKFFYIPS